MNVDLAEFEQIAQANKRTRCKFGAALDALGAEETAKVEAAIAKGHVGPVLVSYLQRRGQVVSTSVADLHRKQSCLCFRFAS